MTLNDPLVHELSMEDYMAAAVGLLGRTPGYYGQLAQAARNWLIDHEGWGPKPRVSAERIDLLIEVAEKRPALAANTFRKYLRTCGIEVTSDGH